MTPAARTVLVISAVLAATGVAFARDDARITAATATTIYIDAGAADGLTAGASWQATVDGRALSLQVAAVASHDAVLVVTGGAPPPVGAVVRLPPGLTPPALVTVRPPPAPTPAWDGRAAAPAMAAVRAAADGTQPAPGREPDDGVRVSGELSVSAFLAGDLSNTSTSSQDFALASQLSIEAGAWRYDHLIDARLSATPEIFFAPLQGAKARFDIYLMRLAYTRPGGGLAAAIGRQPGAPLGELGGVDGARGRVQIGRGLDLTLFGGVRPASDLALSRAARVGADLGWQLATRGDLRARADVGFAADAWRGMLDRALGAVELDVASKRWFARWDATIDLAADAADRGGARVTRASAYARLKRGALTTAGQLGYDRPFVDRALADELAVRDLAGWGARSFGELDLTYAMRGSLDLGVAARVTHGDGFTAGFLEVPLRWASSRSEQRFAVAPHVIAGSLVDELGVRTSYDRSMWGWSLGLGGSVDRVSAGGVAALAARARVAMARPFLRRWRTSLAFEIAAGDGPPRGFLFALLGYRIGK